MTRKNLFITLICKDIIWIYTTHVIFKLSNINANSNNDVVSCHWWWFPWYINWWLKNYSNNRFKWCFPNLFGDLFTRLTSAIVRIIGTVVIYDSIAVLIGTVALGYGVAVSIGYSVTLCYSSSVVSSVQFKST